MATATQTKPESSIPFDIPSVEDATQRIRDLNERLISSSKSASLIALDAYEKGLQGLFAIEAKVASATQIDWVSSLASTHTKLVGDVANSYTKVARDLLK